MSTQPSILPPASTALERAIEQTAASRLAALPAVVASLWNADTCPAAVLPYLAWALSVDEWDHLWGVDKKRAVIRESIAIHRHKGTLAAVKRALAAIGQPDAIVIERGNYTKRNGIAVRDASRQRKGIGGWSSYRVVLSQPATVEQAYRIKRLLAAVQRNCIELTAIDFKAAAIPRDGRITRNAAYTRGVVNTTIN